MWVELGNPSPVSQGVPQDPSVTSVTFGEDTTLSEAFVNITDPSGVWAHHSQAGTKPSYVDSDNEALRNLLAEHYNCPQGRPAVRVIDVTNE